MEIVLCSAGKPLDAIQDFKRAFSCTMGPLVIGEKKAKEFLKDNGTEVLD